MLEKRRTIVRNKQICLLYCVTNAEYVVFTRTRNFSFFSPHGCCHCKKSISNKNALEAMYQNVDTNGIGYNLYRAQWIISHGVSPARKLAICLTANGFHYVLHNTLHILIIYFTLPLFFYFGRIREATLN